MSLSLTLLPIEEVGSHWFSHSVLTLEQDQPLFDAISAAEESFGLPIAERFNSHMGRVHGRGYGATVETAYGEPIKHLSVLDLTNISGFDTTFKNKAVKAYLNHLPDDTKVALYWH